jgi:hypothetical protein
VLNGPESAWLLIPPNGTASRETASTGDLISGYATLLSSIPVNGSALFKTMIGENIVSEAGVDLSKPAKNFIVYVDNVNGAYSGYAVANYGTGIANLTLTLRDSSGNTKDRTSFALSPRQQLPEFAAQRFTAAPAGFEGTIEFASDQKVAAVALRYDKAAVINKGINYSLSIRTNNVVPISMKLVTLHVYAFHFFRRDFPAGRILPTIQSTCHL